MLMTLLKWKDNTAYAKCNNKLCNNFTTSHDLNGSWCSHICFVQNELDYEQRMTIPEIKEMLIKAGYDEDWTY